MRTLAIFGAGGLGIEILELARIINEKDNKWDDFVFVNNGDTVEPIDGVEVMGLSDAIAKYPDGFSAIIAVGEPTLRAKISKQITDNSIPRATIIDPGVHIPHSTIIGEGVCICTGAYISTNATIKDDVLISQHAVIGHDVIIENCSVVSSTCVVCGMVHIKEHAYLGPSSTVKESLTIGQWSVAALGSVVFSDIEDHSLVIGNPARASKRSSEAIFKG